MASSHAVGYSKSVRAKCHGPIPCKNSSLLVGTLRYGRTTPGEFGETIEWRHWGCVTPAILDELAQITVNNIEGFQSLTPSDRQKVSLAISLRRVDPLDVPETARTKTLPSSASSAVSKKRKATEPTRPTSSKSVSVKGVFNEEEVEAEEIEDEARDELYTTLHTNVVGIQYYTGLVGAGEEVLLVREPQNRYDRNAIQVKNIAQAQVGHLPRAVAEKLSPLLDRQAVTVEGVINDGNLSSSRGYKLSISLKIYGPSDKRDQLEPLLIWATPGQRGFPSLNSPVSRSTNGPAGSNLGAGLNSSTARGPSTQRRGLQTQTPAQVEAAKKQQEALLKAAELRQMLSSLEKVDDDGRRGSLLDTLCSTDDILNLPLHPNPPGLKIGNLTVDLLKHQSQALQWCIDRENPVLPKKEGDKPVQFWQLRKNGSKPYYYNIATKTPQEAAPVLGRGALCADAMGLGKTLTMIALILATKNDLNQGFSKGSLIVAPLSVISNWEKQIADHCVLGALSTCLYYGTNRSMSPEELESFDVVITTYQTVVGEYDDPKNGPLGPAKKKKKSVKNLFELSWKRIILDEGHVIRNPKTKMAQAVCALNAERRWVLSGTPIINSPRDLGSLLAFLRICRPLDNDDFFKRLLLRPLKNGEVAGVELLRALMSHICIRRTKEMQDSNGVPLIELPHVEMIKVPVALSEEARKLYDEVEQVSQQRFQNFMNRGSTGIAQSNVLGMLTRMRQLALHPGLVPSTYLRELRAAESNNSAPTNATPLTPEEKLRLQGLLARAIEDSEECPICFNLLDDARITSCAHMFCLPCITEIISRDSRCPMDRRTLTVGDLYERPPATEFTQRFVTHEDTLQGIETGSSAKIDQLVQLLRLTPGDEKSLVFSQFTSFLDKIAETLQAEGIPYVRFDGQMSAKRRQEAIARFSVPVQANNILNSTGSAPIGRSRSTAPQQRTAIENDDSSDDYDPNFERNEKGNAIDDSGYFDQSSDVNPKVMLLSLKAGALGLNLTVANNVYLMDPWWQEGIESQAVDRVNRIGQKKPVHVYQLIAENTVESKVLEIQERKKLLIQQAFSGMKRTETQRQQREARLQDLVQLFGIRDQASDQSASA